jgi:hypothetical protein
VRHCAAERHILIVDQREPLAGGELPQALVAGRRREPASDPLRVFDPVDVLEQSEPGGLDHIGGVDFGQPEVPGHGPDKPRVLIDEAIPRRLVSGCRLPHEARDVRGGVHIARRHCPAVRNL